MKAPKNYIIRFYREKIQESHMSGEQYVPFTDMASAVNAALWAENRMRPPQWPLSTKGGRMIITVEETSEEIT